MKKLLAILLAAAMMISVLAACGPTVSNDDPTVAPDSYTKTDTAHPERYGGVMRYVKSGGMGPTLDPYGQGSWTTFAWAMNIFETPLAIGDDGKIYPLVCDYDQSDDGKTLTLWVREGVCFSNGDPVELEDILASLERAKTMTAAVNNYLWKILDTEKPYEIKDNKLTFYFTEANPQTMTQVFANFRPNRAILPKEVCEKYGTELISDPKDVIGTGPYKLVPEKTEIGVKVSMARNEKYTICTESPENNGYASPKYQYLDGMVFYIVSDDTYELGMMNGDLDFIDCNSEADFNKVLGAAGGFSHTVVPSNSANYIFFNVTGNRPVSDVNLRKAIAACIDYAEIKTSLYGSADVMNDNILLCGDAYNNSFEKTDYYAANSIAKAQEYLAKSNYKGEELKLMGITGIEIIAQAMKEAGINCSYTEPDNATLIAAAGDPTMDWDLIFRSNPLGTPIPAVNDTYYKNWGNARAAELVTTLTTTVMGSKESLDAWKELDDLMVAECPIIMMFRTIGGFAHPSTLHYNNTSSNRMYWNAYWDNPAEHNKW